MGLAEQFEKAIMSGDFSAPATFAEPYRDIKSDAFFYPSVEEVALESLDYSKGPQMKDVFAILVKAAWAGDQQAIDLIDSMAKTYASYYEVDAATPEEAAREDYEGQTENIYIPSFMS